MKKHKVKIVLALAALTIAVYAFHPFFKKTYLDYELVYASPIGGGPYDYEGTSMDYVFYHSKPSIESDRTSFLKYFTTTASPNSTVSSGSYRFMEDLEKDALFNSFDFNQYSYVVVRAQKVTSMYYSDKTTYFDDRSSPVNRCQKYGEKCVFVTYDPKSAHGDYVYRVKRDVLLRGFYFNG